MISVLQTQINLNDMHIKIPSEYISKKNVSISWEKRLWVVFILLP